jgi:hypothetical protein
VSWFREPGSVLVADNAPLDEWLAFNALDFIYACDLGDDEAKARFAAAINSRAPLARAGAAHYRRFFCAFTSPAYAAMASRVIDDARSPDQIEPQRLVRELITAILGWRQELRERSTREVGELAAAIAGVNKAIGQKDAHIQKLDQLLAAATQSVHEAQGALAQKDARLVELEASTRRTAALERELEVILTSHSWRLTAPLRRFRRTLQPRTFITSHSWRVTTPLRHSRGQFSSAR